MRPFPSSTSLASADLLRLAERLSARLFRRFLFAVSVCFVPSPLCIAHSLSRSPSPPLVVYRDTCKALRSLHTGASFCKRKHRLGFFVVPLCVAAKRGESGQPFFPLSLAPCASLASQLLASLALAPPAPLPRRRCRPSDAATTLPPTPRPPPLRSMRRARRCAEGGQVWACLREDRGARGAMGALRDEVGEGPEVGDKRTET